MIEQGGGGASAGAVIVGSPAARYVCRVCYAAPGKCPACGQHMPGGVEVVVVANGREDVEYTAEQVIVHGIDGDAVFDRGRVAFVRFQPDRERRR